MQLGSIHLRAEISGQARISGSKPKFRPGILAWKKRAENFGLKFQARISSRNFLLLFPSLSAFLQPNNETWFHSIHGGVPKFVMSLHYELPLYWLLNLHWLMREKWFSGKFSVCAHSSSTLGTVLMERLYHLTPWQLRLPDRRKKKLKLFFSFEF